MRWVGVPATSSTAEQEPDTADGATGDPEREQLFIVRFFRDECTISADSSGDLLHRRGWRLESGKAPMRETLGAAMLLASGWADANAPLVDPFCGSGTIPIEAALLARRIPPGHTRDFAFRHWPGHDDAVWRQTLKDLEAGTKPAAAAKIVASDRDAGAIESAKANAARAGVANDITFETKPLSAIEPPADAWLITNPPYGVRVGDKSALRDLYARLGQLAKSRPSNGRIVLLSADHALDKATGLQFEELFRTTNGGVPVRCLATRSNG